MFRESLLKILKVSASFGMGSILTYAALRMRASGPIRDAANRLESRGRRVLLT